MPAAGAPCQPWCVKVTLEVPRGRLTCLPAAYVQQAAAFVDPHLRDLPFLRQPSMGTDPAGQVLLVPFHQGY